nr:hypothetical protein JVH1_7948 [Rhodococcus sp. JVH1]
MGDQVQVHRAAPGRIRVASSVGGGTDFLATGCGTECLTARGKEV